MTFEQELQGVPEFKERPEGSSRRCSISDMFGRCVGMSGQVGRKVTKHLGRPNAAAKNTKVFYRFSIVVFHIDIL
jgi:hypothetical protein